MADFKLSGAVYATGWGISGQLGQGNEKATTSLLGLAVEHVDATLAHIDATLAHMDANLAHIDATLAHMDAENFNFSSPTWTRPENFEGAHGCNLIFFNFFNFRYPTGAHPEVSEPLKVASLYGLVAPM